MEKKKKIDDLFKSELGSYTETPPPAVWDALEDRLDAVTNPRGPLTWLSYLAVLCLFIIAAVWMATRLSGNKEQLAQQTTTTDNNSTVHSAPAAQTRNNAANTERTGNVTGAKNTTTANTTDNENNTPPASVPATGPNRISNTKTAVYTSTGAPVSAGSGNRVDNTTPNDKGAAGHSAGKPGRSKIAPGVKTNKATSGHTGKRNNKNNRPPGKHNKNTYGTYAVADDQADNSDNGHNNRTSLNNNSDADTRSNTKEETIQDNKTLNENTVKDDNPTSQNTKNDPGKFVPNDVPKPKKSKAKFDRFEAGVKAGYEQGFNSDAAQKGTFAAFTQYRLSKKIGIMLQPAIKYGNVTSRQIGDATTYYSVNGDKMILDSSDSFQLFDIAGNPIGTLYYGKYRYQQSHDSIIKTNRTGGKYFEIEMPVLAKYYVSNNFSLYGGINLVYSKLTGLTEQTYVEKNLVRTAIVEAYSENTPPVPLRPDFKYSGTSYTQYTGPQYPVPTASTLRIGYMAGFSWEFEDRWLIDALVQQTFIKPNLQGGFNTYTPLTTPYFRLTLGYKIVK